MQNLPEGIRIKESFEKALLLIADHLERGVSPLQERGIGFNMGVWYETLEFRPDLVDHTDDCGTVCCISGHAQILMGKEPSRSLDTMEVEEAFEYMDGSPYSYTWTGDDAETNRYMRLQRFLRELFLPPFELKEITPAEAGQAIRNWLADGEPHWGTLTYERRVSGIEPAEETFL